MVCSSDNLPRLRRLFLALGVVVLCLPARASAGTLFVIDGRGWGHGVGMSQYGARGYAEAGWGYERILEHFYVGTELRTVPARPVRVLLAERLPAVQISSTKPFKVVDARGKVRKLKPGKQNLVAGEAAEAATAAALRARRRAAAARRERVPWRAARPPAGRQAHDRQPAAARPLPPRRRALGDAGRLASRGASSPGRRRSLVRARDAEAGHALRSLCRHAKPGLRRHPRRGGIDEPCDRLDRRPRRLLERAHRDDLLPLDLGRENRLERRGVARCASRAVSRVRPRSLRRPLEAPPLGTIPVDTGQGGAEARRRCRAGPRRHARDRQDARSR